MTKLCEGHDVQMEERHSKTKVDDSGQPKAYFGHSLSPGKMCFGIKEEEASIEPEEQMQEYVKDLDADMKHEDQQKLGKIEAKPATKPIQVPDKPMTRKDWTIKDIIIGLGVFSSPARKEGMDPVAAFRDMHIWEWMDVAYGTDSVYEEWKEAAKKRIK